MEVRDFANSGKFEERKQKYMVCYLEIQQNEKIKEELYFLGMDSKDILYLNFMARLKIRAQCLKMHIPYILYSPLPIDR